MPRQEPERLSQQGIFCCSTARTTTVRTGTLPGRRWVIRRVELRRREMEREDQSSRMPGEYWEEDFPDLR